MDMVRFNIYERLRDFKVPSTVLDNIFLEQTDAQILQLQTLRPPKRYSERFQQLPHFGARLNGNKKL